MVTERFGISRMAEFYGLSKDTLQQRIAGATEALDANNVIAGLSAKE